MLGIFNIVVPVFAIVLLGYGAVRLRLYPAEGVRGLIAFVNNFATPFLLFRAMMTADFRTAFNPVIIGSFYTGTAIAMLIGALLAFRWFHNRPGVAVASGFSASFTNTVLLGIPIIHRAYGEEAMPVIYSIIGLHAPLLFTAGMMAMEIVRRDGGSLTKAMAQGAVRIIRNPLLIGIALGILANVSGLELPEPAEAFTAMMAQAVLPVALFGIGGALNEYRLAENWGQASVMAVLKLMLAPTITWILMVPVFGVDPGVARYAVLLAAMPSGINVFVFATYYERGVDIATNTILITTASSLFTVSLWLYILG